MLIGGKPIAPKLYEKGFEQLEKIYDKNVVDWIDRHIGDEYLKPEDLTQIAFENQWENGTEPQMILYAIDDLADSFNIFRNERFYLSDVS